MKHDTTIVRPLEPLVIIVAPGVSVLSEWVQGARSAAEVDSGRPVVVLPHGWAVAGPTDAAVLAERQRCALRLSDAIVEVAADAPLPPDSPFRRALALIEHDPREGKATS